MEELERLEGKDVRHEKENPTKKLTDEDLKTTQAQLKTKGESDESDRMEKSGYGTSEEMSEPADNERATGTVFEASLNELISHLQNSIQRKLKEKRKACILHWKERAYPENVIQAAKEIDNAKRDGKWEECLQKTNAIVKLIQILPENEIPDKQELLVNIYSYFGPTLVEANNFSMVNGYDEIEWINAIEKFLKTLPDEKYPYEAALLYYEITIRVSDLPESFKSRSLTAARKAKDHELQLYGAVLFVFAEWMVNNIDIGPAKQRDYFCRVAFEMDRSLQLAKYLDDKVATKVIQNILQEVEVRRKRPFLQDIDRWMKRQISKPANHLWMQISLYNHSLTEDFIPMPMVALLFNLLKANKKCSKSSNSSLLLGHMRIGTADLLLLI